MDNFGLAVRLSRRWFGVFWEEFPEDARQTAALAVLEAEASGMAVAKAVSRLFSRAMRDYGFRKTLDGEGNIAGGWRRLLPGELRGSADGQHEWPRCRYCDGRGVYRDGDGRLCRRHYDLIRQRVRRGWPAERVRDGFEGR